MDAIAPAAPIRPSAALRPATAPTSVENAEVATQAGALGKDMQEAIESDPDYQVLQAFKAQLEGEEVAAPDARLLSPAEVLTLLGEEEPPSLPAGASQTLATRVTLTIVAERLHIERSSQGAQTRTEVSATRVELQIDLATGQPIQQADPLALDLSGAGFTTTGVEAGLRFDLDADGKTDTVSFAQGDTAFLALDRNGNGRIDDGRELFGTQNGAANGYAELARYDENGDAQIDAQDAVFAKLSLLRSDARGLPESTSLAAAGIASIGLANREVKEALNAYDQIAQKGTYTRLDGSRGTSADLLLGFR